MQSIISTQKNYLRTIQETPIKFKTTLSLLLVFPFAFDIAHSYQNFDNDTNTSSTNTIGFPYRTLTIVAAPSPSTVFEQDGFKHGFGYDLTRNYAEKIHVNLNFVTVDSDKTALDWVNDGRAQMALTTTSTLDSQYVTQISGSCNAVNTMTENGLNTNLTWVFSKKYHMLPSSAQSYLCDSKNSGALYQLANFYATNYLPSHDIDAMTRNLEERLPSYKLNLKASAKQNNLDWEFLTAIAYQESYLKPDSVSHTGVRGVMMLTESTAKQMGVEDRTDPTQSIEGGAKYFNLMLDRFNDIPYPDRNWFALVAYNMGPNAVNDIRKQLRAEGKNDSEWMSLYQYLENNEKANSRHQQALQYVKRIRVYLEHIKTSEQIAKI
ncbi:MULTISPECIES: transglycosylase SLT domain-containing protein [unclassified Acinetobacter]|uniref:transglycosylase SLT domain-containing protein n=1 Tax=unclassified Acinetobacter TaxID=196816 RepID=UPI0035BA9B3B